MGLQEQNWFFNIVRPIFGFFDRLVYRLIKWVLFGVFDLSALSTNSEVFNGIYSRIYVILGVFMAFKLSFSFFQYIINPDSMGGKSEQGVGKLFTRVFLMLFALMVLPAILFGREGEKGILARAQDAFLPVVPRLIFGTDSIAGNNTTNGASTSSIEQISDEISLTILRGFFFPSKEVDTVCDPNTSSKYEEIKSLDEFAEKINETCAKKGDARNVVGLGTKYYVYNYLPFVSTIVGVLVVALLLGITLDVAKRIFKLIILEIIAPVPIMSLIDPKSSKGGAFQSWVKSLTSTFVDIFLKFGLLYLVIVQSHDNGGLFTNFPEFQDTPLRASYLILILILGLIFFAKEAPKFIKDALGLKSDGGGLFDDLKTVGKAAGLVGGAAVGAAGIIGSGAANWRASKEENDQLHEGQDFRNFLRNSGSALAGAIGGAAAGAKGLTGKDAGIKKVMDMQGKRNAQRAAHSTPFGRFQSNAYAAFTGQGLSEKGNAALKYNNEAFKAFKDYKTTLEEEALKKTDFYGGYGGNQFNYNKLLAAVDRARSSGSDTFDYNDGVHSYTGLRTDEFDTNVMNDIKSSQASNYADRLLSDEAFRGKNGTAWNSYLTAKNARNNTFNGKYDDTKKAMGEVKSAATKAETDMRYQMRRANDRNKK